MTPTWGPKVAIFCLAIAFLAAPVFAQEDIIYLRVGRGWGSDEVWEAIVREFEAQHPHVKVETDPVGWNLEKVLTAHLAGTPYDVIYAVIEQAQAITDRGLLQPLDPFLERDKDDPEVIDLLSDIHPNLWEALSFGGKRWYVPYDWNTMVMWYNARFYDEAGLVPPSSDWTWDDFLANAQKLTVRSGDGSIARYGFGSQDWSFFGMAPWIFTGGGRILNPEWNKSVFGDPINVQTLEFLQAMAFEHQVMPTGQDMGRYNAPAGTIAMMGCGRWCYTPLKNNGTIDDWALAFWPQNRERTSVIGVGGHGISSNTAHAEEAWEFVKFTASYFTLSTLFASEGWHDPVSRTSILLSEEFSGAITNGSLFLEALNYVETVPSPPQFPELNQVFVQKLSEMANGQISAQEAVSEIHRLFTAILNE